MGDALHNVRAIVCGFSGCRKHRANVRFARWIAAYSTCSRKGIPKVFPFVNSQNEIGKIGKCQHASTLRDFITLDLDFVQQSLAHAQDTVHGMGEFHVVRRDQGCDPM